MEMLTSTGFIGSAILIILTLFYTRFLLGPVHSSDISGGDAAVRLPPVPYWLPWVGHALSLLRDPERFIRRIRYVFGANGRYIEYGSYTSASTQSMASSLCTFWVRLGMSSLITPFSSRSTNTQTTVHLFNGGYCVESLVQTGDSNRHSLMLSMRQTNFSNWQNRVCRVPSPKAFKDMHQIWCLFLKAWLTRILGRDLARHN